MHDCTYNVKKKSYLAYVLNEPGSIVFIPPGDKARDSAVRDHDVTVLRKCYVLRGGGCPRCRGLRIDSPSTRNRVCKKNMSFVQYRDTIM